MITKWEWSLELEAKRLAYIAKNIATGFYELNGFVVVPPQYLKDYPEAVVFPDVRVNKIRNFWRRVKQLDSKDWSREKDPELILETVKLLNGYIVKEPGANDLKKRWRQAEKAVIKEIERTLNLKAPIRSLSIYLTNFGPSVSFNIQKKAPYEIELFLRFDKNIHTITEGIISSLIQNDLLNTLGANFTEKEIMIDWLVGQSSICRLVQKYESRDNFTPTTEQISKKEQSRVNKISRNFLLGLGYTNAQKGKFKLVDGRPVLDSKPLHNLNGLERKVLAELIKKNGDILSFDAIGQLIFRGDEEYSLWAISKFIQRLRDKLEKNGISGSFIQTVRKREYLLR